MLVSVYNLCHPRVCFKGVKNVCHNLATQILQSKGLYHKGFDSRISLELLRLSVKRGCATITTAGEDVPRLTGAPFR